MDASTLKIGYYPGSAIENNVISFLKQRAVETPDKPVFMWPSHFDTLHYENISFKALYSDVSSIANSLASLGVKKHDRVLVFMPMSHRLYATVFAVQMLGAAAVFLDSWARHDELSHVLTVTKPVAIVSTIEICNAIRKLPEHTPDTIIIHTDADSTTSQTETYSLDTFLEEERTIDTCAVESETTALITFTTGSTGKPKGANRTHRFLASQHYALREVIPHRSNDLELTAFPIFALNNIAGGVSTMLPAIDLSKPTPTDGNQLLKQILSSHVTTATISPSMLRNLLQALESSDVTLSELRRLITGGAPISLDDAKQVQRLCPSTELVVLYGSTEVEPIAEITGARMITEAESERESLATGVNVGVIHPDLEYRFISIGLPPQAIGVSLQTICVPKGEIGELIVSGEHVCRGYVGDDSAFQRSKILDKEKCLWHRTGDLGHVSLNGDLFLVGRVHSAFKRKGQWLFPVMAEILIKRIPGVAHAAYLGMTDDTSDTQAVAAIQVGPGIEETSLVATILSTLNAHSMVIDTVVFVDSMPLDPRHHSKVQYGTLQEMILSDNCRVVP